ncbi:hypothetical protein HY449_04915 [Candidatus Pacearchaeota archaeon]|nr:hypothetical protein [Candidatus Pacearchaeota archaeon]
MTDEYLSGDCHFGFESAPIKHAYPIGTPAILDKYRNRGLVIEDIAPRPPRRDLSRDAGVDSALDPFESSW